MTDINVDEEDETVHHIAFLEKTKPPQQQSGRTDEYRRSSSPGSIFWKNLKSRKGLEFINHLGNHCLFYA